MSSTRRSPVVVDRHGLTMGGVSIRLRDRRADLLALALTLLVSLSAGFAGALAPSKLVAAAFACAVLLALGFLAPALFLLGFVMVRPLLDNYTDLTVGVPSANPAGLVAAMLIVLALALPLVRRRTFVPPSAMPFALIVVLTAGLSAIAMFNFGGTVGLQPAAEVVRVAALVAVYVLAANVLSDASRLRMLVIAIGLSGVVPALSGISELISGPDVNYLGEARVSGPFNGPNDLGMYLALSALVLIGTPSSWLSWPVRLVALVPMLVALVPTYSRAGYVCFLLGLVLLEGRRHTRFVVAVFAVAVAVVALIPSVQDRVLPKPIPNAASAVPYESYSWRIQNWGGLLNKWAEQPIVGYGTRTTYVVNPRRPVQQVFDANGGFAAHNAGVRVLVEGGVVLLLAYLAWGYSTLRALRRLSRAAWTLRPIAHLVAVLWFIFGVVVLATDDPFEQTAVMLALLALLGALEGVRWREAERGEPVPALLPSR